MTVLILTCGLLLLAVILAAARVTQYGCDCGMFPPGSTPQVTSWGIHDRGLCHPWPDSDGRE